MLCSRIHRIAARAVYVAVFLAGLVAAGPAGGAAEPADGRTTVVRPGETLSRIAARELGDARRWPEIARANGLEPPYRLRPGRVLVVLETSPEPPATDGAVAPSSADPSPLGPAAHEHHAGAPPAAEEKPPQAESAPPVAPPPSDPDEAAPPPSPAGETLSPPVLLTAAPVAPVVYEDLEPLVALAHDRNRKIRAARAMAEAASHRIRPAGSLEDPVLGIGYQEGMGFKDFPSIGEDPQSQVMITLEQMFPGRGKRALRREVAEHVFRNAGAEVEAVAREVEADVRSRYWEIYRIDVERDVLARTRENLRAIAAGVETRYSVGEGIQEDVLRAGLEVSMATERLRMLERERRTVVAELNALLDRPPDVAVGRPREAVVHDLPDLARLDAVARDSCPILAALRHVVEREDAAMRLAEAERRPDWGIMGGFFPRGALEPMWSLGFKLTLPIRQGERQDEWVREARANLEAAREGLEGHWREIRAKMEDFVAGAEAARDLVRLYDSSLVPQASLALRSSLSGYQSGRVDFMTVVANVVALRQYEVERARRLSEFHQAVAGLEAVVAQPLEVIQ